MVLLRRANVTSVTGCSRSSGSQRITIPAYIAAQLELSNGDLMVWELHEGANGKPYLTLRPIKVQ